MFSSTHDIWSWRLVCDLHLRDSVTSALIGLHWLPVPARVEFKLCTIVYQSFHGSTSHYINDMLQPVSTLRRTTGLRSASNCDLFIPRTRLRFDEQAFSSAAPRLWNALPTDVRKASTLSTFKKKLKTYLFSKYIF